MLPARGHQALSSFQRTRRKKEKGEGLFFKIIYYWCVCACVCARAGACTHMCKIQLCPCCNIYMEVRGQHSGVNSPLPLSEGLKHRCQACPAVILPSEPSCPPWGGGVISYACAWESGMLASKKEKPVLAPEPHPLQDKRSREKKRFSGTWTTKSS